jgi:hypothetical protein
VETYDRGGGLSFAHPKMQADFRNALSGYDSFHQTNYSQTLQMRFAVLGPVNGARDAATRPSDA